jgi:hypothetical protein
MLQHRPMIEPIVNQLQFIIDYMSDKTINRYLKGSSTEDEINFSVLMLCQTDESKLNLNIST